MQPPEPANTESDSNTGAWCICESLVFSDYSEDIFKPILDWEGHTRSHHSKVQPAKEANEWSQGKT